MYTIPPIWLDLEQNLEDSLSSCLLFTCKGKTTNSSFLLTKYHTRAKSYKGPAGTTSQRGRSQKTHRQDTDNPPRGSPVWCEVPRLQCVRRGVYEIRLHTPMGQKKSIPVGQRFSSLFPFTHRSIGFLSETGKPKDPFCRKKQEAAELQQAIPEKLICWAVEEMVCVVGWLVGWSLGWFRLDSWFIVWASA